MSAAIPIKQRPFTPPPSFGGDTQFGLRHTPQNNGSMKQPPQPFHYSDGSFIHSGQSTTYGSPSASPAHMEPYMQMSPANAYQDRIRYQQDQFGRPLDLYQNHDASYIVNAPNQTMCLDEGFHAISPPTPTISDFSSGDRRYGRNSRTPVSKKSTQVKGGTPDNSKTLGSPKIKKGGKAKKGDRPKMPKLDAPLSELTQDYKHIPVRDMEKWVNRSAEIRRREVEGRKGYVTRPMNSFMLYRSAYAERTKFWCSQNNHQVVSSVSGESWPLEPPDIRDRYNEYARIERDNHQKAHPGYKFSPSKAQNTGQKKKDLSEESEIEEGSENDEVDSEWRPATRRHENTRDRREASVKTAAKTLPTIEDRPRGLYHISSYQAANPGKPLPTAMNEHSLYGQYLETSVVPNSDMPSTEDVHIRRTHYGNPHVGLPGGTHSELLDQHQVGYDVGIGSDGVYISNPMLHSDDNDYMFNDTLIQEQQPRGYTNAFLVDQRIPSCGPEDVIDYSQAVPIWQDQSYNSTHDDEEYAWFESNGNR